MSNNVVVTKGHHTCGQFVNDAVAIKRAPFKSICDQSKRKDPFLGEGFYFWDDNIEAARWWGKSHYYGKYTILEYDFTLSGDHFLDLVGCRRDIRILLTLREKLKKNGCRDDDLEMYCLIERDRAQSPRRFSVYGRSRYGCELQTGSTEVCR